MKRTSLFISVIIILFLGVTAMTPLMLRPPVVLAHPSAPAPANWSQFPPSAPQAKPALSLPDVNIAFFDDPTYVDTANSPSGLSEADNLQASLTFLSHTNVTTFSGITAGDFTAALTGKDILIIPELENGDLGADLSPAARTVIADFVANGGGLIIHGSHNNTTNPNNEIRAPNFLNNVFGFSVISKGVLPSETEPNQNTDSDLRQSQVGDTAFFDNINNLRNHDATQFLISSSLPGGSKTIYTTPFGDDTCVALMPFGDGQIIFMGWDWVRAAPNGNKDSGWLDVLDSALHQLMPPNLSVVKTASASQVQVGQSLTYQITFKNAGGVGGGLLPTNIVLTDVVPISVTNIIVTNSGATITPTGTVDYIWQVADLPPTQGGIITLTGIVNSNLPQGTVFTNTATIAGTNENDPSNNQSQVAVTATEIIIDPNNTIYLPLVVKHK